MIVTYMLLPFYQSQESLLNIYIYLYLFRHSFVFDIVICVKISRSQLPMKKSLIVPHKLSQPVNNYLGKEGLEKLLKQHFGYSGFRGKQLEAIEASLSGTFRFIRWDKLELIC